MNEENEDLVTFSEAARIKEVTPQAITDYVNRNRLRPILKGKKRLLRREDVENLEKGASGRPSKPGKNTLKEMIEKIRLTHEKINEPEKYYPQLYKELFQFRNQLSNSNLIKELGTSSLWWSPIWRKNKRILRKSLKQYSMLWVIGDILVKDCVTRKYKDPLVQSFYEHCVYSERMYETTFFLSILKHDFLSYTEKKLGYEINKDDKESRERQLIVAMFEECMDEGCSAVECKGREPNPLISGYRVIYFIKKDKLILSNLTGLEKTERIKRILYDNTNRFRTKSTIKINREWRRVRLELRKK